MSTTEQQAKVSDIGGGEHWSDHGIVDKDMRIRNLESALAAASAELMEVREGSELRRVALLACLKIIEHQSKRGVDQ